MQDIQNIYEKLERSNIQRTKNNAHFKVEMGIFSENSNKNNLLLNNFTINGILILIPFYIRDDVRTD